MIDGMITATAVVATMPLIHNNAGDFESFRSAILDAHPNGSPLWVRWSCPGVQRWHEAGPTQSWFLTRDGCGKPAKRKWLGRYLDYLDKVPSGNPALNVKDLLY